METKIVDLTIPLNCGFTHMLFNLASQGYSHIKITYSGSGDSGGIDEIYLIERGCIEEKDGEIVEIEPLRKADIKEELKDIIIDRVYQNILESARDWYNNDGGGGTLYISCDDASYIGEHYVYIITTDFETLEGKLGD